MRILVIAPSNGIGQEFTSQPAKKPNKTLATLGIFETIVALIWLVGNDITGYGVSDDGLIPAVSVSFLAFWAILFNDGDDDTW